MEQYTLPSTRGSLKCHFHDIKYLEASSNYTTFHFADGTKIVISKTMKYISLCLPQIQFYRVHNSFLVNLDYLQRVNKSANDLQIELIGNIKIPVSRSKKNGLLKALQTVN
jgi:two-component system, LytTR family, response regulator